MEELPKAIGTKEFRYENLILSGTHTHGAPGGFLMNVMLDFPDLGFVTETFDALVSGIVRVSKLISYIL